ncbi:uncharacterized protein LOC34618167 [Cyclospora cayetanensis]|uniref:Uncharacterized protein LOC34618167 n=1 Tax=Cyclospora cayetanensis TaxID=88456 RepID=A0A6P6RWM2_9EIME|nr:uncharacterized protein LOC34618167 [Cyclospora cayetanensis]
MPAKYKGQTEAGNGASRSLREANKGPGAYMRGSGKGAILEPLTEFRKGRRCQKPKSQNMTPTWSKVSSHHAQVPGDTGNSAAAKGFGASGTGIRMKRGSAAATAHNDGTPGSVALIDGKSALPPPNSTQLGSPRSPVQRRANFRSIVCGKTAVSLLKELQGEAGNPSYLLETTPERSLLYALLNPVVLLAFYKFVEEQRYKQLTALRLARNSLEEFLPIKPQVLGEHVYLLHTMATFSYSRSCFNKTKTLFYMRRLIEPCIAVLVYFGVSPEALGVPQLLRQVATPDVSKREGEYRVWRPSRWDIKAEDSLEGSSDTLQDRAAHKRFARHQQQFVLQQEQQRRPTSNGARESLRGQCITSSDSVSGPMSFAAVASAAKPTSGKLEAVHTSDEPKLTWDAALLALVDGTSLVNRRARAKFLWAVSDWLLALLLPLWEEFRGESLPQLLRDVYHPRFSVKTAILDKIARIRQQSDALLAALSSASPGSPVAAAAAGSRTAPNYSALAESILPSPEAQPLPQPQQSDYQALSAEGAAFGTGDTGGPPGGPSTHPTGSRKAALHSLAFSSNILQKQSALKLGLMSLVEERAREQGEGKFGGAAINTESPCYALTVAMMRGMELSNTMNAGIVALAHRDGNQLDLGFLLDEPLLLHVRHFQFNCAPLLPSSLSVSFEDIAPDAFECAREVAGITDQEYRNSLCSTDFSFIEFQSNSKSGQFFFFSHDGKFLIKTISKAEVAQVLRFLPAYIDHILSTPLSLLTRIFGIHRVELYSETPAGASEGPPEAPHVDFLSSNNGVSRRRLVPPKGEPGIGAPVDGPSGASSSNNSPPWCPTTNLSTSPIGFNYAGKRHEGESGRLTPPGTSKEADEADSSPWWTEGNSRVGTLGVGAVEGATGAGEAKTAAAATGATQPPAQARCQQKTVKQSSSWLTRKGPSPLFSSQLTRRVFSATKVGMTKKTLEKGSSAQKDMASILVAGGSLRDMQPAALTSRMQSTRHICTDPTCSPGNRSPGAAPTHAVAPCAPTRGHGRGLAAGGRGPTVQDKTAAGAQSPPAAAQTEGALPKGQARESPEDRTAGNAEEPPTPSATPISVRCCYHVRWRRAGCCRLLAMGSEPRDIKSQEAHRTLVTSAYFIAMGTAFDPSLGLSEAYDIKGSIVSRLARDADRVKKDVDWLESGRRLRMREDEARILLAAHERDCRFLEGLGVFDYSMLIGIHECRGPLRDYTTKAHLSLEKLDTWGDIPNDGMRRSMEPDKRRPSRQSHGAVSLLDQQQHQEEQPSQVACFQEAADTTHPWDHMDSPAIPLSTATPSPPPHLLHTPTEVEALKSVAAPPGPPRSNHSDGDSRILSGDSQARVNVVPIKGHELSSRNWDGPPRGSSALGGSVESSNILLAAQEDVEGSGGSPQGVPSFSAGASMGVAPPSQETAEEIADQAFQETPDVANAVNSAVDFACHSVVSGGTPRFAPTDQCPEPTRGPLAPRSSLPRRATRSKGTRISDDNSETTRTVYYPYGQSVALSRAFTQTSTPYLGAPAFEGGFGLKVMSVDRREIFFFGLIDFLSPYTARRYFHTAYKRLKSTATCQFGEISPVPPGYYARRQIEFVQQHVIEAVPSSRNSFSSKEEGTSMGFTQQLFQKGDSDRRFSTLPPVEQDTLVEDPCWP